MPYPLPSIKKHYDASFLDYRARGEGLMRETTQDKKQEILYVLTVPRLQACRALGYSSLYRRPHRSIDSGFSH